MADFIIGIKLSGKGISRTEVWVLVSSKKVSFAIFFHEILKLHEIRNVNNSEYKSTYNRELSKEFLVIS